MSERQRFRAAIYRVGMNYCVDVPATVGVSIGGETYVNVAGEVAGTSFRSRLTPRGGGAYRLFLNGEVRSAAGVGVGDVVEVELWRDLASRGVAQLPHDLVAAVAQIDGAEQAFEEMTEARRAGMVAFLEGARTPVTRAKYLRRVVDEARGRIRR